MGTEEGPCHWPFAHWKPPEGGGLGASLNFRHRGDYSAIKASLVRQVSSLEDCDRAGAGDMTR